MTRWVVVSALVAWVGSALVLSEIRWFSRPPLTDRLRPYTVGAAPPSRGRSVLSVESFRDALGPLAHVIGERMSRMAGIGEDAGVRLRRIHSPLDATAFRVRQLGASLAGFAAGALMTTAFRPELAIGVVLLVAAPLLSFLVVEQRLSAASRAWQRRVLLELPVVAEQLAMLISAGYSVGAALSRIARRGTGACASDLRRVTTRMQHGLSEIEALREWAEVVAVPAVERLTTVVAVNRTSGDIGRLLVDEARALREQSHRELTEHVERRGQQVWIPVTVATLVPGVIFIAVPFIAALQVFAG